MSDGQLPEKPTTDEKINNDWHIIFVIVILIWWSRLYKHNYLEIKDLEQFCVESVVQVLITKRILMVFNFHWYNNYPALDFLKEHYIPFFKRCCRHNLDVIFFGPEKDEERNVYSNSLPEDGWFSYKSLQLAYQMKPDYDGYLFLNDDSFVNPLMFDQHDPDKILAEPATRQPTTGSGWVWMHIRWQGMKFGKRMKIAENSICQKYGEQFQSMCSSPFRNKWVTSGRADFVYYPAKYMPLFTAFVSECLAHSAFLEMCVPSFTANFDYMAVPNHRKVPDKDDYTECGYVHPVKYGTGEAFAANRGYMQKMFRWMDQQRLFNSSVVVRGPCVWSTSECETREP